MASKYSMPGGADSLVVGEDEYIAEAYLPDTCRNKHLHDNFIPIEELSTSHFPEGWQSEEFINNIKVLADLVVHIRVVGISKDRPDFYEGSGNVFPHGRLKGNSRVVSYGSGYVYCEPYSKKPASMNEESCTCTSCIKAGNSQSNRWYYFISTSKHVVYDLSEAKNSTFRCFFDNPQDSSSENILHGVDYFPKQSPGYAKEEVCYVLCVTHNETLMTRLNEQLKKRTQIFHESITFGLRPVVLVSHPHGRSKMISIGNFVHLTVPIGEEFPTDKPKVFGGKATCVVPYKLLSTICWEDFFQAHGMDLCSLTTESAEYVPSKYYKPDHSLKFADDALVKQYYSSNRSGIYDPDMSVSIVDGLPKVKLHFLGTVKNNPVELTPDDEDLFSIKLPPNSTFTLPSGAEYAMRTTDSNFYYFPPGTTIRFGDGKDAPLSPELGFADVDSVCLGYVYYKVQSCPGSSGGSVIINTTGSFDVLPHGGALAGGVKMCYGRLPYVSPLIDFPRLPFNEEVSLLAAESFVNDAVERVSGLVRSLITDDDDELQAGQNIFLSQFNEILRKFNDAKLKHT